VVKRGKQSEYQIWIEPDFNSAREELPGNIRQRVKRILNSLGADPRPSASKVLDIAELELPFAIEIRRLRLEHWRILYAVNDREGGSGFLEFIIDRRISTKICRNLSPNYDSQRRDICAVFVHPQDCADCENLRF